MKSDRRRTQLFVMCLLAITMFNACTLPSPSITAIPSATFPVSQPIIPIPQQEGWRSIKILATETQPLQNSNPTNEWVQTVLTDGLRFSSQLQIRLVMQSSGVNGILLVATRLGLFILGEPWWKGHKRFELLYEGGTLNVLLRDGSQEAPVYLSQVQLEPGNHEVLVIFDQRASNVEIQHSGKTVMQISTQTVGDFPNGLFPEGQILAVELINGPNSGCIVTGLEFLVPASDEASPSP